MEGIIHEHKPTRREFLHIYKDREGFHLNWSFLCLYRIYTMIGHSFHSPNNVHWLHLHDAQKCTSNKTFPFCSILFPILFLILLITVQSYSFHSRLIIRLEVFISILKLMKPTACILIIFWKIFQKSSSFSVIHFSFAIIPWSTECSQTIMLYIFLRTCQDKWQSRMKVFLHFLEPVFVLHCTEFYWCKSKDIQEVTEYKCVFLFLFFFFDLELQSKHHNETIHGLLCTNFHVQGLLLFRGNQIQPNSWFRSDH